MRCYLLALVFFTMLYNKGLLKCDTWLILFPPSIVLLLTHSDSDTNLLYDKLGEILEEVSSRQARVSDTRYTEYDRRFLQRLTFI